MELENDGEEYRYNASHDHVHQWNGSVGELHGLWERGEEIGEALAATNDEPQCDQVSYERTNENSKERFVVVLWPRNGNHQSLQIGRVALVSVCAHHQETLRK